MATREGTENLPYHQINAGDEYFDLYCNPCNKEKLNKGAVKYCVTCKEYFCDRCVKNHKSFKVLSKHVLVDPKAIKSSSPRSDGQVHAVPTQLCKTHPLELVDMYCHVDDIVGCSVCFTLDHKHCDDIHYIPKYIQSNFPTEQVHQINDDLTKAIKAMKKLKARHDNVDKSKAICKQEIQKYRAEINHIMDTIEARTLAELDARHKGTKKKSDDTKQNICNVHDEMIMFRSEIDSDQSNGAQKFVIAKLSQCVIKQSRELLKGQTTELTFNRNMDIITFLKRIVALGMVSPPLIQDSSVPTVITSRKQTQQTKSTRRPTTSGSNHDNNKVSTRQHTKIAMATQKYSLYKIVDKSKYNIHQGDEEICGKWSSCILSSGNILLVDLSENILTLVDRQTYKIISSLELVTFPWSVCRVSSTEAGVCLDNKTIQFVSARGDKLVPVRTLSMRHTCKCFAVVGDKMYVCDAQSVYIYTLNGELMQTIRKGRDKSGRKIFSGTGIWDITVSDDGKMIHVLDEGVITLNTDGNVVWRYSGTMLNVACGVCTDGNGYVIVCGLESHNVIQLGPDGQYIGEIVTCSDGLKQPCTVCYDRHNHKLIVGQYENDNITVFTVQ